MRPLCILLTGDPVPSARQERGGFGEMIRRAVGPAWAGPWLDVESRDGAERPDPGSLAGIIITGSSASVTERAGWVLDTEAYLRRAVASGTPIFGICFGHQLLGQALGGRVETNPRGRQIGTLSAEIVADDPLIDPSARPFWVNTTHRDIVTELPPGAVLLARTPLDPNAALCFAERVWGVQFHPEFDAVVMRAYISERREILAREGFDPDALLEGAGDALPARSMLVRFVERFVEG